MPPVPLVDVYLSRFAGDAVDRTAVAASIARAIALGRDAWPRLAVAESAFVEHLATHVAPADLEAAQASDLWLACACAASAPGAVAAFEAAHLADIHAVHAQSRPPRPPLDELVQVVMAKLFVGPSPKIADYAGAGPLKNWVRVLAARALVDLTRTPAARESPRGDDGFLAVPAPGDDPELEYLKRTYRNEMRQAFEQAARDLSPEERNVLRDHYAQGLTIDEIAKAHGIHRATAARRIEGARETLLRGTRQLLMAKLKLSRRELESVARLIESQLHVTIERVLQSAPQDRAEKRR
jgi:RNA polymerase sigma-70 factor (ECF subfamily)